MVKLDPHVVHYAQRAVAEATLSAHSSTCRVLKMEEPYEFLRLAVFSGSEGAQEAELAVHNNRLTVDSNQYRLIADVSHELGQTAFIIART